MTTETVNDAAPQATATGDANVTPVIVNPPTKAPKAKKPKAKAPKVKAPSDDQHAKAVIELLFELRKNHPTKWVDLRNATKEGEKLHKLLIGHPVYTWRKVGESHYLESKHDGTDTAVAYVLPHDPMREYKLELAAYEKAIAKRKSKSLKEPKKPVDRKKSYRWVITSRRGAEEHDGFEANLALAQAAVTRRKHLFSV